MNGWERWEREAEHLQDSAHCTHFPPTLQCFRSCQAPGMALPSRHCIIYDAVLLTHSHHLCNLTDQDGHRSKKHRGTNVPHTRLLPELKSSPHARWETSVKPFRQARRQHSPVLCSRGWSCCCVVAVFNRADSPDIALHGWTGPVVWPSIRRQLVPRWVIAFSHEPIRVLTAYWWMNVLQLALCRLQ